MKKLILISIFSLICLGILMPVNAQTISEGPSAQFLYSDFVNGKVKMKNYGIHDLIMNYNTISEKMVYKQDDNLYDLINPEMTDTIFLQGSKFVPVENAYYKVLLISQFPFFVQYKGDLLLPGTTTGYGVDSQVSSVTTLSSFQSSGGNYNLALPSEYKVRRYLIYWLRKDGKMNRFINEKQFLKISPDKEPEVKQFIKQNRIKFDRISDIVKLAEYFNKIVQ
jgi:hypothetical protein